MAKLALSTSKCVLAAVLLSLSAPSLAEDVETPADRYTRQAQNLFDDGKFVMSEKSWRRALMFAKKSGDSSKTANAMVGIGKALVKEERFFEAENMFQQALVLYKEQGLDTAPVDAQIVDLANSYRAIDWSTKGADVTRFLADCGTQSAYAIKTASDGTVHIVGNLSKKWMKSTDDLYKEYAPQQKPAATTTDAASEPLASSKATSQGKTTWSEASPTISPTGTGNAITGTPVTGSAIVGVTGGVSDSGIDKPSNAQKNGDKPDDNPVKQLKLDKKIEFDIVRENASNYRVANIKGISANVGLWVKIADMLIAVDEQNNSYAQVKAGTMGVSKTVKVSLPNNAYKQLKDGIDQIDPFLADSPKRATAPATDLEGTEIGLTKNRP